MRLYRQTLEDFCLYTGMELTEQEFSALQKAAGQMSAKMRAVRIISASGVSKKDLERRLVYKGEDPKQAKEAVAWLEQLDLLDDGQTAKQIVSRCISKGYGKERAKQALYEKRIPKQYWEEALLDYPDQSEHIAAFLRTKLASSREHKDVRRATDSLIRRGYTYGEIRRVLSQLELTDFLED